MAEHLGTLFKTGVAIAAAIAVVSMAPPLTEGGSTARTVLSEETVNMAEADNRYGFCARQLSGVDCNCFARRAGQVLDNQQPRAAGWAYADPWKLAKMQATDSCSGA